MGKDYSRRGMNVFNADGEEEEKTSAGEDIAYVEFTSYCYIG